MKNNYLNYDEQCALVEKALAGNDMAMTQLIAFFYPFIAKLAGSYVKYGCEFDDLLQEGYLAVYNALPKYRPEFKAKFSTYALWHVKKQLNLYAQNQRLIQIPAAKLEMLKSYKALLDEADSAFLATLTDAELAELLDISEKDFKFLKNIPYSCLGFDASILIKEQNPVNMEDQVILNVMVESALSKLSAKERFAICRYYQLEGFEQKATHEDISRDLHCSPEWVRQLLISGRRKLRTLLEDAKDA